MNTHHRDLLNIITDDTRAITRQPWQVSVNGTLYAIATDGQRALYLPGDHGFEPLPTGETSTTKTLADFIAEEPLLTHAVDRTALLVAVGPGPARCPTCHGKGEIGDPNPCRRCDGAGEITCNLDHDHDCPDCDGQGHHRTPCTGIGPHPGRKAEIRTLRIAGLAKHFDAQLLRGIIDQLDGPIMAGESADKVALSGPGWTFIVAPLRWHTAPLTVIAGEPRIEVTA